MKTRNVKVLIDRISNYYRDLLEREYKKDEALEMYNQTCQNVVEQLLPYALEDNFWWEKEDFKMAYYQMRNPILVVSYKSFKEYYYELMGTQFDESEFKNDYKRKSLLVLSQIKYNEKKGR